MREAEKLVARKGGSLGRQAPLLRVRREKPRDLARIEQRLSDALTAAVEIRVKKRTRRGEQGEVAIRFGSLDELNGLLDKLGLEQRVARRSRGHAHCGEYPAELCECRPGLCWTWSTKLQSGTLFA